MVHDRYKSLGEVEQAFRRSKTVELEMRPVHVLKESSTRGHLLVVMLACLLMQELGKRWAHLDLTVKEGLDRLNTYCAVEVAGVIKVMLQPRKDVQSLITAADKGTYSGAAAFENEKRRVPSFTSGNETTGNPPAKPPAQIACIAMGGCFSPLTRDGQPDSGF